jgi:hypothetical protein
MDKFLNTYNLPKLIQEEMDNQIEAVTKISLLKKGPVPKGVTDEFYKMLKELIPILCKYPKL